MVLKPIVDRAWNIDAPKFVVHNDLKFNNILFDEVSGQACSVVDLDTCSFGYLFYDFGDFIRAACATNDEDVIEGMAVDLSRMKVAASAFLDGIGRSSLNEIEKQQCLYAPTAIATSLASRFLTDYLEGDIYFTPHYPGHNLVRAGAQIALAESFNSYTGVLEGVLDGA
jgi:aminoglycoside phosphotransferase (APT) family kinase protein